MCVLQQAPKSASKWVRVKTFLRLNVYLILTRGCTPCEDGRWKTLDPIKKTIFSVRTAEPNRTGISVNRIPLLLRCSYSELLLQRMWSTTNRFPGPDWKYNRLTYHMKFVTTNTFSSLLSGSVIGHQVHHFLCVISIDGVDTTVAIQSKVANDSRFRWVCQADISASAGV